VAVLVLNWRGAADTLCCAAALDYLRYPSHEVVLIDNGSDDGSEAALRAARPDLRLLQTGGNLGFAGGNNVGIRWAQARGFDFVWLLNNDATPDPDALAHLVEAAVSPTVGMVGSKILYDASPARICFAGGEIDWWRGIQREQGLRAPDDGRYDRRQACTFLTGCSLLARVGMIDAIGLLDERYFLYFEDMDWCARAVAAGWQLVYEPRSVVRHRLGGSSAAAAGHRSSLMDYYDTRNGILFMRQHARGLHRLSAELYLPYRIARRVASALRNGTRAPRHWCAIAAGLRDGLLGVTGPDPVAR
jgi:GT2 family glycosyltransferase